MKVVFLDIDGVLNSKQYDHMKGPMPREIVLYSAEHARWDLDPAAIARLNRIHTVVDDVKYVVSSTWRKTFELHELQEFLGAAGFTGELIGRTPVDHELNDLKYLGHKRVMKFSYTEPYPRGFEIQQWLDEHQKELRVENFVILDDTNTMAHLGGKLVRTSMKTGLRDRHTDEAIAKLHEHDADQYMRSLPDECSSCRVNTRMAGSSLCEECQPGDADENLYGKYAVCRVCGEPTGLREKEQDSSVHSDCVELDGLPRDEVNRLLKLKRGCKAGMTRDGGMAMIEYDRAVAEARGRFNVE